MRDEHELHPKNVWSHPLTVLPSIVDFSAMISTNPSGDPTETRPGRRLPPARSTISMPSPLETTQSFDAQAMRPPRTTTVWTVESSVTPSAVRSDESRSTVLTLVKTTSGITFLERNDA